MQNNKFICISGTDGTGKSTLALRVFQGLEAQGKKAKLVYGRHRPFVITLINIMGKHIFLKKSNMFSDYDQYLIDKRVLHNRLSKLSQIYVLAILLEYCLQVFFKVIIPHKLGYWIISDRYVYDTVINDLAVDSNLSFTDVYSLLCRLWYLIPKPDIVFLLRIPEEIAMARKSDIPSSRYLKIRNEYYDELSRIENMVVLDGTRKISELESFVTRMISGG